MKLSKKLKRKLKKRLLRSMSSIAMILMLLAIGNLAGISAPFEKLISFDNLASIAGVENISGDSNNNENQKPNLISVIETAITDLFGTRMQNTDTITYIYDAQDLADFRDSVNAGNDYAGKKVYLMNDIDMSSIYSETVNTWTPIADANINLTLKFSGTFDGNYHSITNFYINTNNNLQALFGVNYGFICNIVMKSGSISGGIYTASIAGMNYGKISNCGNNIDVISNGYTSGGICAVSYSGIYNCYNTGNVTTNGYDQYNESIAGGIVGVFFTTNARVENCYNTGHISVYSYGAGGIIGAADSEEMAYKEIINCYNVGELTDAGNYTGSILGGGNGSIYIDNCYYINNRPANGLVLKPSKGAPVLNNTNQVLSNDLKVYENVLGAAYVRDVNNINEGYPILSWQSGGELGLNVRQAYVKVGKEITLNIDTTKLMTGVTLGNINWSSSNTDIATVTNGVVKGIGIGSTTITGTDSNTGLKVKCVVNVISDKEKATAVPQLEQGINCTIILKEDGTVWSSGINTYGNLGDGTTENRNEPVQVKIDENTYLTDVVKISNFGFSTLALTKNGEVYAWGYNDNGNLGLGDNEAKYYATKVKDESGEGFLNNIIDIEMSINAGYAIKSTGEIYGWGNDSNYALLGTSSSSLPKNINRFTNAIKITSEYDAVGVLLSNGETWAWGCDQYGALGKGLDIAGSGEICLGNDIEEVKFKGYSGYILKDNGTVWSSGFNSIGQLGLGDTDNRTTFEQVFFENGTPVTAKALSGNISYLQFLGTDGKVYVSGGYTVGEISNGTTNNSTYPITMKNQDGSDVTDAMLLASDGDGILGTNVLNAGLVRRDGTVWISGDNTYGQFGNAEESSNYFTKYGTDKVKLNLKNEYIHIEEEKDIDVLSASNFNVFIQDEINQNDWTWESSNTDVATVDNTGKVTGVGLGRATITGYGPRRLKARAIINVYRNKAGAITVPQVHIGESYTTILKEDGTVWVTGLNNVGQLGQGDNQNSNVPVQIKIDENTCLTNVRKIATTTSASMVALTKDGEVYGCGYNQYGQLATGDTETQLYAHKMTINTNSKIIDIASSEFNTFALTSEGELYYCGTNNYKVVLENEATYEFKKLSQVSDLINITSDMATCIAMDSNGLSYGWGQDNSGQLGQGTTTSTNINDGRNLTILGDDIVNVDLGEFVSIIKKEDGEFYVAGLNAHRTVSGGLGIGTNDNIVTSFTKLSLPNDEGGNVRKIIDVKRQGYNTVALASDKTVWASGYNGYGQLSQGDTTDTNIFIQMKNNEESYVTDALLLGTGESINESSLTKNTAIIREDGTVWLSGDNTYGQIGNGTSGEDTSTSYLTKMGESGVSVNARNEYIKIGDTLYINSQADEFNVFIQDGENNSNQSGWTWESSNEDVATVDNTGKVTGVGLGRTTITGKGPGGVKQKAIINVYRNKAGAITVPQVLSGEEYTIVLKEDGTVWGSGYNSNGELGQGDTSNRKNPVQVKIDKDHYLENVIKISTGNHYIIAMTKDGYVYGWGCNEYGQLAQGNKVGTTNQYYAIKLKVDDNNFIEGAIDINAGNNHSMVLTETGSIFVAGNNYYYQNHKTGRETRIYYLRDTEISNGIRITGGHSSCGAMLSNGEIIAWGWNGYGSIESNGNPGLKYKLATDANWVTIHGNTTFIIKEDKTVWSTGCNEQGQLGLGNTSNKSVLTKVTLPLDESKNTIIPKYLTNSASMTMLQDADNKVWVCGYNGYGQFCDGTTNNKSTFVPLTDNDGTQVDDVLLIDDFNENHGEWTAGRYLSLIREDGTVWLAGDNTYGQFGNGTTSSTKYLTQFGMADVKLNIKNEYIKIGEEFDINVTDASGFNVFIQDELNQNDWTWESSNEDVAEVDSNGVVTGLAVGHTTITAKGPKGLKARAIINVYRNKEGAITVPQVEEMDETIVVLREDGTVWASGRNNVGQLGQGNTTDSNRLVQIKIDENTYLTNVRKISTGQESLFAMTADGKVYAWGWNGYGQLAQGTTIGTTNQLYAVEMKVSETEKISDIIDISSGNLQLMAINKNGDVYVVGNNYYYQNLTTGREEKTYYLKKTRMTNAIRATSGYSNCEVLLQNGQVIGWGQNLFGTILNNGNPGLEKILSNDAIWIELAGNCTYIINENKELYVTGYNGASQLAVGDSNNRNVLTKAILPKDENENKIKVDYVGSNGSSVIIQDDTGKVWGSGYNGYGQLSTGDTNNKNTFVPLMNKDGTQVSDSLLISRLGNNSVYNATGRNTVLIRQDGTVWASGDNTYGQFGNKTDGAETSSTYLTQVGPEQIEYNEEKIIVQVNECKDIQEDLFELIEAMNVFIQDNNAEIEDITYEIQDETIATLTDEGIVQGIKVGLTKLTATETSTGATVEIPVEVIDAQIVKYNGTTLLKQPDGNYKVEILDTETSGILEVTAESVTDKVYVNSATEYGEGSKTYTVTINPATAGKTIEVPIVIKTSDGETEKENTKLIITRTSTNAGTEKVEGIYKITVDGEEVEETKTATVDKKDENLYILGVKASVNNVDVKITAKDENAKITSGSYKSAGVLTVPVTLTGNETTITYTILAEDGKTTSGTKTVKIVKLSSVNAISKIEVNEEEVTPDGKDGIYRAVIKGSAKDAKVKVTTTNNKAGIKIDGEANPSSGTGELDTTVGIDDITNTFTITVTAEDGTEEEYTLIITRMTSIIGKITTENFEGKHKSTVKVYKTSDTREEDSQTDAREVIAETETEEDGTFEIEVYVTGETEFVDEDENEIADILEKSYDVLVSKPGYLDYRVTDIYLMEGESSDIGEYALIAGDVAKDGEVEISDLIYINDNIHHYVDNICDLNEDSVVNRTDQNILRANFGKRAETVEWVNPNPIMFTMYTSMSDNVGAGLVSANLEVITQETTRKGNKSEEENEDEEDEEDIVRVDAHIDPNTKGNDKTTQFILPIEGEYIITSNYGERIHPITGEEKRHTGIDLVGEWHTEVMSISDGEVVEIGVSEAWGNYVEIKHNINGEEIYSFYAHLSEVDVEKGDEVEQGEKIGLEGGAESDPNHGFSTGHHLHFEIRTAKGYENDVDPNDFMDI